MEITALTGSDFDGIQHRELSRMRREVASRRIARETIANALGRFGVRAPADQAEAAPVTPASSG